MAKIVLIILLMAGFLISPVHAEKPKAKNCHDPSVRAHWDTLVAKNPEDMELQTLHALWLGLCMKIDREELPYEEAWDIFERAKGTMIQKRQEEKTKGKRKVVL